MSKSTVTEAAGAFLGSRSTGERVLVRDSGRIRCALVIVATVCGGFFALPASAQGVPVEAANAAQKQEATEAYRAAVQALDAGKNEEALLLLQKSYGLVASPNSRLMLARTLVKLGRHAEAYEELVAVADAAKILARAQQKYELTAQSALADLEELKQHVAFVTLEVDGVVTLNGAPLRVGASTTRLVLPPGPAEFRLALSNGGQIQKRLELVAGQEVAVKLEVPAPEVPVASSPAPATDAAKSPSISRDTLGFVGAGVGVVGFLGFTIFGLASNSDANRLASECMATRCPESLYPIAERGRSFQTVANVGLGVGLIGVGSAAFFFWPRISERVFGASVAISPSGVLVGGRF